MGDTDFRSALVVLLRECFEGIPRGHKYTWFVEENEGIFDALASVDARRASTKPSPDCATFAAHAYHLRYILVAANSQFGGPKPVGSWNDSWKKQSVDEDDWAALIADIRSEYDRLLPRFSGMEPKKNSEYLGATALVPHCAFHLGAMRQIMRIV